MVGFGCNNQEGMKTQIVSWATGRHQLRIRVVVRNWWWAVERPVTAELYSSGEVRKAFFADTFEDVPHDLNKQIENLNIHIKLNEHDPV